MNTRPHCLSSIVTETATFRDYECGSSWTEGLGLDRSQERESRHHAQDVEADDEINRRRMARHFESQHWGT